MKKICLAAALVLALPSSGMAAAGTRDEVVQGIVRCGAIANDRQWLDCVYGAAQPMRAQLGLSPAPLAQQRLVPVQGYGTLPGYGGTPAPAYAPAAAAPPPPRPQSHEQGFFAGLIGEKNVPDIVSRMTAYSFDGKGWFTVTLANGQTWKQASENSPPARWARTASRYVVTIRPGAFGTFNLTVAGEPGAFKVRRVR
jgi:hypothetical protein